MDGERSASDLSFTSLLQNLPACQSKSASEKIAATNSGSQAENKKTKNKKKLDQKKQHKSESRSSSKSAAGCSGLSSQLAKTTSQKLLCKRNWKGETLLHKACKKKDVAQVKMLLQAGISVNTEDYAGWTALHEACAEGTEAVVEELLKAGAVVNARSNDGVSPLHDAVFSGHYQVVKLLLQNGANPSYRTLGGLSAFDMTEKENINEMLRSFQTSPVPQDNTCIEVESGATSEVPHQSLSCSISHTTNLKSSKSDAGGGASETTDVQPRNDDVTTNDIHLMVVTEVLEEVRSKQAEMSTWLLNDLKDADRYRAALIKTQSVLTDVLAKQRLEKDNLSHKYRTVPHHFRQRVLKSQFLDLISHQRSLVEILQKQTQLEETYDSAVHKFSTQLPNHLGHVVTGHQPEHSFSQDSTPDLLIPGETLSCHQDEAQRESCRPVTQVGVFQTKDKGATHLDKQKEKASSCQSDTQLGTASQLINFNMKGKNALIQTRTEDDSRCLRRLIQGGVMAPGSALQLILKGSQHMAHVMADGSLMSKGKLHRAPERWLESILGNNIPVSSSYALAKVTFSDKPLSYYIKNMEAREIISDCVEDKADSTQQESVPGDGNVIDLLRCIKYVELVSDDEFGPSALVDYYWDKVLKQTPEEFEDWETEL